MIQKFVDRFMSKEAQDKLTTYFSSTHPEDYQDIVKRVVEVIYDEQKYNNPDPSNIHIINDGDYQGTLVFIIPETGYQPSHYWFCKVDYGSCSGCDTLQRIESESEYDYDAHKYLPPNAQQVKDYMTLALHIVQGISPMQEENEY